MPDPGAKHIRVATAEADGVLVSQQGRLYGARLAASGGPAAATFFDGADDTGQALLSMTAVPERPDDWGGALSLPFTKGLYAVVTGGRVYAYWERQ